MKINKSIIIFALIVSLVFCYSVPANAFDARVRETIQDNRNEILDSFMRSSTHFGDGLITGSVALSITDDQIREHAWKTQLVSALVTTFFKVIIGRQRPSSSNDMSNNFKPLQLNSSYHSMPSGHTSAAFALAASVSENTDEYRELLYFIATLVGVTRIYNDNHWASDVLVSAGVGYLSAKFVTYHW